MDATTSEASAAVSSRQRWFTRWGEKSAIYTPPEFHKLIQRECRAADRFHNRFSLALFEVGTRNENSVLIRRLVRTIHNRFRGTDEVGWYSKREIGVILPFTPEQGAWKLAEYVSEVVASVTFPPPFTIYSYPSQNWPLKRFAKRYRRFMRPAGFWSRVLGVESTRTDEFHALVARERGRADRNGHIFSLLVFRLDELQPETLSVRRLLATMNQRLRDTDEIGWYDDSHVGAILPYVDEDGARKVGDAIVKAVAGKSMPIFTIYTYPDSWFPETENETAVEFESDDRRNAALRHRLPQRIPDDEPDVPHKVIGTPEAKAVHGRFMYRPIPAWKRGLDIVGSFVALVILSPVFLLLAVYIKLVSRGPVFFRQERVGYMQRPFTLLKFRTMHVNTETESHTQYMRKLIVEDSESTPMVKRDRKRDLIPGGGPIRTLCLDEIPQLINVWRGDMSLVGPRPCLAYEAEEYLRWHARRFDSLPGMTGLWQVSGKNRTTFKEMIRFDIQYEKKRSLWMDIKILFRTPFAILGQLRDRVQESGQ